MYPTSGPTSGVTDVIVEGKGFQYIDPKFSSDFSDEEMDYYTRIEDSEELKNDINNDNSLVRCRFGTPANYAIVEA